MCRSRAVWVTWGSARYRTSKKIDAIDIHRIITVSRRSLFYTIIFIQLYSSIRVKVTNLAFGGPTGPGGPRGRIPPGGGPFIPPGGGPFIPPGGGPFIPPPGPTEYGLGAVCICCILMLIFVCFKY